MMSSILFLRFEFKLVCDLSIGAITDDLERTLTLFS